MGLFYERILRPILFTQDPEKAHDYGLWVLRQLGRLQPVCRFMEAHAQPPGTRPIELFGLTFPNAVGLAAGMDKNAEMWPAAAACGFGHVEIGTVTHKRQPGNVDRPRLFRYPKYEALVNRMGFNNDGAETIAKRLKHTTRRVKRRIPLGINIGKSKVTPLEQALDDYLASYHLLAEFADYFTINVSSPNTPNLRQLQSRERLTELLQGLSEANRRRAENLGKLAIPLLLKISPDLTFPQIDTIIDIALENKISGLIATNTTVERSQDYPEIKEAGGLSGSPLNHRACQVVNYVSKSVGRDLPIIGTGGASNSEAAGRLMDAGASLVQIYTGFVYKGPFFPRDIARALAPRHSVIF